MVTDCGARQTQGTDMTEPELPHNFTSDLAEAINDHRAAVSAIAWLLMEKGIITMDELRNAKAKVCSVQDQHKAEADKVHRERTSILRLFFGI